MLPLHVRITDAGTGKPTAVRLSVTGPGGEFFAPLGRFDRFPAGVAEGDGGHLFVGGERFCYVDGGCEIALPTGVPLRVRVSKGPAYTPLDQSLTVVPGQLQLRFDIIPAADNPLAGWTSADTRVHFLPPHAALLEAAAEDVNIVNLLAVTRPMLASDGETYPTTPNLMAFSGRRSAVETDGHAVVVNTLNTHPVLGKLALLNAHRVIHPLAFGGADGPDDWSVCDWTDQCHRKGGVVVWADAFRNDVGPPGGEALVAAILGKIDALEYDGRPRSQPLLPWYYRLLNAGVPLPLVGGSARDSARVPVGSPRTYAKTTAPGYAGWVDAVLAGRTVVTNGPLLRFEVNGLGPGETLAANAPGVPVPVRVTVGGLGRAEKIEVLRDGQVIASAPGSLSVFEFETAPAESGWMAARCVSPAGSPLDPGQALFAHTSPVWLKIAGKPLPARKAALPHIRACIEQTQAWLTDHGTYTDPRRQAQHLARCAQALGLLGAFG